MKAANNRSKENKATIYSQSGFVLVYGMHDVNSIKYVMTRTFYM